ncbi:MAG: hypothetical protein AAF740_06770 [Bacteroidota bacterium]
MTPKEKKAALLEHINTLEGKALEDAYQTLLPQNTNEVPESDIKHYVVRMEVPAAEWVFFELLLAKMCWEFDVLYLVKHKPWSEIFAEIADLEWEEHETLENLLNDL